MIGKTLAHYEILGPLGSGGMGRVFRARDTRLDREVALKLLPPDFASDSGRLQRFEQEARTLARLNHPNIVTVFAVEEADGQRFLTMELVEGVTLERRIGPDGMTLGELLDIVEPLASAVAAAHERGIVHRDLKPANVMVARDGPVKVLDFGLAKLGPGGAPARGRNSSEHDASGETVTSLPTAAGTVMGTAPYMSPEQARGEPVDHRSDIFSLGVMIYRMATGRLPFRGSSTADMVSSILRDAPLPVTELRPDLPDRLANVVKRCLEKDPERRFQSARDLGLELRDLREVRDSGTLPAARPNRTHAWIGAAALTAVAVVASGLWIALRDGGTGPAVTGPPASGPAMIVVFPFENLGSVEDAYFAAGIAEEIRSRLAGIGSLSVISRSSAVAYDRRGKTMAEIGDDLGVDYVLDGTVRWARLGSGPSQVRVTPSLIRVEGDRQVWSASYDETLEEILTVQSRIAGQVIDELNLELTDNEREALEARPTEKADAYQAYLRGVESWGEAKSYDAGAIRETIAHFERAVELDPGFALAWAELANAQSWLYHLRYDTSETRRELARKAAVRAVELDPDLPRARFGVGLYHYRCHRDYERALAEMSIAAAGLPNDPDVFATIAAVRRRLGEFEEAARDQERAFRLDPHDHNLAWDLAVTLACLRRYDDAFEWIERAVAIEPDDAAPYGVGALIELLDGGDVAAARRWVERMPSSDSPFVDLVRHILYLCERDYAGALEHLEGASWEVIEHTTSHRPRWLLIGNVRALMGDENEARSAYRRALAFLDEELATRAGDARIHAARGFALAGLGRKDEAIAEASRAVELYPTSRDRFHGPQHDLDMAWIELAVGNVDAAFGRFEHLLEDGPGMTLSPALLRLDPRLDAYRDDPRLLRLLEGAR